jgi:hypothetical protein
MRRSTAAIGSAAFFVVAPGTVVGLIPWLVTRWELPDSTAVWPIVLGVLLIVAGLMPAVHARTSGRQRVQPLCAQPDVRRTLDRHPGSGVALWQSGLSAIRRCRVDHYGVVRRLVRGTRTVPSIRR